MRGHMHGTKQAHCARETRTPHHTTLTPLHMYVTTERMEDLPPHIGSCGASVTVSRDKRSATSGVSTFAHDARVRLTSFEDGKRVRGRLRVDFSVEMNNVVRFGFIPVGTDGDVSESGTQVAAYNRCLQFDRCLPAAPFAEMLPGSSGALLFDMIAGTIDYEVNGAYVGTLFRFQRPIAIAPVFYVICNSRVKVTRVQSDAGEARAFNGMCQTRVCSPSDSAGAGCNAGASTYGACKCANRGNPGRLAVHQGTAVGHCARCSMRCGALNAHECNKETKIEL